MATVYFARAEKSGGKDERAEASPPLSVEFVEFSLYRYLYIIIFIYRFIYFCGIAQKRI